MTEETRRQALADSAAELITTVDELRKVVEPVGKSLKDLSNRADRTEHVLRLAFFGLAVDLILSVVVLILFIQTSATAARNTETNARLTALVNDAYCPMLSVFLGSYDPSTRSPGVGRQAYEDAYSTFRRIWVNPLHCTTALVPPRNDLVTTTPPPPPPR